MTDDLMTSKDEAKLAASSGPALQKGEYLVKIYQLIVNDPEPCRFLIDSVFASGMTVLQAKKKILPELREKLQQDIPLNRCRLRENSWKNPGTIFLDHQKFDENIWIPPFPNREVFFEIIQDDDRVTSGTQLAIFTRHWHPSTFEMDPLKEIVLEERTIVELIKRFQLAVKLGRSLRGGEYRVEIYQLIVNDPEPCRYLIDTVFERGMTVLQAKKKILPELREKLQQDLPLNRCRLRKKIGKNPGRIFLDHQKFQEHIQIRSDWEVFFEIIREDDRVTSGTEFAVLTRHWHPSTFKMDPFKEIILEERTVEELKKRISESSGILRENIEVSIARGTFSCEVQLLTANVDLEWHSDLASLWNCPLHMREDGLVVYFRDKTEKLKQLSEEEKREISEK